MSKKVRYAAIIEVSSDALLKLLDFDGGTIHDIRLPQDRWKPNMVEIIVEHSDLDKVEDGYALRRLTPAYQAKGGGLERIDPPKRRKVAVRAFSGKRGEKLG